MEWQEIGGTLFFAVAAGLVAARVLALAFRLSKHEEWDRRLRNFLAPFVELLEIGHETSRQTKRREQG